MRPGFTVFSQGCGVSYWKNFHVPDLLLLKKFFFMNFHFKNGCENEFKDHNEKSYNWSRHKVSQKFDFKAVWTRNGHADNVGVKLTNIIFFQLDFIEITCLKMIWEKTRKKCYFIFARFIERLEESIYGKTFFCKTYSSLGNIHDSSLF